AGAAACVMTAGTGYFGHRVAADVGERSAYMYHNYTVALSDLGSMASDVARIDDLVRSARSSQDAAEVRSLQARSDKLAEKVERAIIDKNARIGNNVQLLNDKGIQEATAENYVIRDGIIIIPKGAIVPDGTVV
ncbi:MAG TPA: hypothetical protein PKZ53_10115, partial [Acidobacteriota bacterium]|nr:hypothetical protein [Acidobacteriota bacterium]